MEYLILMSCVSLVMAMAATTQRSAVLDTSGNPLRRGVEYYVKPAITEAGGPFTLVSRNGSCPFYVGQRNVSVDGIPVTFAPYDEGDNVVRELKNFKVTFSAATICVQSTTWKVGETEPVSGRRLIATGEGRYTNYFYIRKEQDCRSCYSIQWCPTELCPICRFECGSVGNLFENGQRLAALDDGSGSGRSLVFERAGDYESGK